MAPVVHIVGRFAPGATVRLVKVTNKLCPTPGDPVVDERVVDDSGVVTFDEGIEQPATGLARYAFIEPRPVVAPFQYERGHYWAIGHSDGAALTLRCVATDESDPVPQMPTAPAGQRKIVAPKRRCTLLTQTLYDRERGYDRDSLYRPPNENCPCEFCVADREAA
jgi:hypothetical protein